MKLQRLYDTFKGHWNWCSVYHSSVSHSTSDFRAAVFENVRKLCLLPPARSVFQPQSIFRALESLSRCLDSTWKCKGLNTLLIKWQTGVPGHPSFQWTTPRCIPHGSSQSSAKSFWLPTAVLRSVMFLFFLTSLVSASLDSAPSWHQPPNSLHPSLCLILSFEWSQIFGGC